MLALTGEDTFQSPQISTSLHIQKYLLRSIGTEIYYITVIVLQ